MKFLKSLLAGLGLVVAGLSIVHDGLAQESWPSKALKIVVPSPPGSGPDLLARTIGQSLAASSGQPVVVENKGGANGIIGSDAVAKAAADGHTLLLVDRLALITNPALYSNVPFNWQVDLKPVTEVARVQLYLVTGSRLPARTFNEFIQYVRANPDKLSYATSGNGHINHLSMEAIVKGFGLKINAVPYKSAPQITTALVAGEVVSVVTGPVPVLGMVRDGRLRALAVGAEKRTRELPDTPTIVESGGTPAMLPPTVFVIMAPGSTPDGMVGRMNAALTAVMRRPEVVSTIEQQALELVPGTAAQAAQHMRDVGPGILQAIRDAGIKME